MPTGDQQEQQENVNVAENAEYNQQQQQQQQQNQSELWHDCEMQQQIQEQQRDIEMQQVRLPARFAGHEQIHQQIIMEMQQPLQPLLPSHQAAQVENSNEVQQLQQQQQQQQAPQQHDQLEHQPNAESADVAADYLHDYETQSLPPPTPPTPQPYDNEDPENGDLVDPFEEQNPDVEIPDPDDNLDVVIDNIDNGDMQQVFQTWELSHTEVGYDPLPVLTRLAQIFDAEIEIYMRKDPDPFEDRHPHRSDPTCNYGTLLKQFFRKDQFFNKLVTDYLRENYYTRQNIQKSALEVNIAACRLILVIMPGFETSNVFQGEFESVIHRLYSWAEDSIEPLQSYATGLLAACMEVSEIATQFRWQNGRLIPKMIKRLHMMQAMYKNKSETIHFPIPPVDTTEKVVPGWLTNSTTPQSPQNRLNESGGTASVQNDAENFPNNSNMSSLFENSRDASNINHKYRKIYIPIHPPTAETSQMLILRYLTTMVEFQEFLGAVFENDALQLILNYIDKLNPDDTCLAFEALKYLASMFAHKKFVLEFISRGGMEALLSVPHRSTAATGVAITLFALGYSEDAMQRICTLPKTTIKNLVNYGLWILGRSYDSAKCHATMFFGLCFQFKIILDEFDEQDGLRKLFNVVSILKILSPPTNDEEDDNLNEDAEFAQRQLVRHVCVALKRYMEAHLFYKYNSFMRLHSPNSTEYARNPMKATKTTLEQKTEQIRTLQESTSARAHWTPVDQIMKLGGIPLLLKIVAMLYEWNNSGRSETVRSIMDVLSICCVVPKFYGTVCDNIELPENSSAGINYILGAAHGDITTDAEVQKAALALICHLVCAPTHREQISAIKVFGSSKKFKTSNKYNEDLIEKVWASVCSNNGIISLLSLMQTKTPITDADCIRGMACRALAGLARSERVRQIISKLPLFASGQIQVLMRDPILQEKRSEHVIFQKYALEILERVSGRTKLSNNKYDPTLSNMHKANVIAQTKIQYNEEQLLYLIHDHLESRGMIQTAQKLQKEANLNLPTPAIKSFHQSPFDYKALPTSSIARTRLRGRMQDIQMTINGLVNNSSDQQQTQANNMTIPYNFGVLEEHKYSQTLINGNNSIHFNNTPIKLVKKSDKTSHTNTVPSSLSTVNAVTANLTSSSSSSTTARSLEKPIVLVPDKVVIQELNTSLPPQNNITLSTIVTEYLTNQHALCVHPMVTCPQFDLFTPHKCPDPKPNRAVENINATERFFRAQAGYNTSRMDRHYVHSNFAPWRVIRAADHNEIQYSAVEIIHSSNKILVGTQQGEAKAYNSDGTELFSHQCHGYYIDSIRSDRTGRLVLTSCSWRAPLSVLWSIHDDKFDSIMRFNEEFYCEFSNLTQDRVLGTQNECAIIYDINTRNKLVTFTPKIGNQYTKNRATFSPTDELILSDGVLWDVRSAKEIHKFDKLNQSLSGVFHPNGLEIISNTEVWDLRTFHLLQTVPVLDQSSITFSPMRVMYATSLDLENRMEFDENQSFDTSFKVLDAYDYTSISTIDVKRYIFDLSINATGCLIALVENLPAYDSKQETYVKIYSVGVKKNEQQEEDDDEPESAESSDSDSRDLFDVSNANPNRRRRGNDNDENNEDDDDDDSMNLSDEDDSDDDELHDSDDNDSDESEDGNWINIDWR